MTASRTMLRPPATSDRHVDFPADLWGFGGAHGGLVLAVLVRAMEGAVPGGRLRSVTGQFHQGIRAGADIEATVLRRGGTVAAVEATATSGRGRHVTAIGTFSVGDAVVGVPLAPPPPPSPAPESLEIFAIPTDLVPFGAHTEIRPVGDARPYRGGDQAELVAWVRLRGSKGPASLHQLIVLLDALAPSYAAILTLPAPIPTVEYTFRPALPSRRSASPWVLLRARTHVAGSSGWVDERIDAWDVEGRHLASATQLRLARAASAGGS